MKNDLWTFEKELIDQGVSYIAGVDEAGRGPLAGPVVSAAVILPPNFDVPGIDDSKKLTHKKRALLYQDIYSHALAVGIGIVDVPEIDRINILNASLASMVMAISNLSPQPDYVLIDGIFSVKYDVPQQCIKKGDSRSISIAAASIVAKVTRDNLMERYHLDFPQFGFSNHKGYGTKAHREAIKQNGICLIHRKTFAGVKEFV